MKRAQQQQPQLESPTAKRRIAAVDAVRKSLKLCARCETVIARASAALVPAKGGTGHQVALVNESQETLQTSTCKFCNLLASIKKKSLDRERCSLYAFSANDVYARVPTRLLEQSRIEDTILFGILPSLGSRTKVKPSDYVGAVSRERKPDICIGPRKIQPGTFDLAIVKSWLAFCEARHKTLCLPPARQPPMMRVIDVDTEDDMTAPDPCHYVALSYVWGKQAAAENKLKFTQVVIDSLALCKLLGYKYLWVDEICINQDDADIKRIQIGAMDLVYGNAQLTIIAAEGDSAHGLPGLGSRRRVEQDSLCIGDTTFIRTFPHAAETARNGKWATRGWTFQEGLLSNRRLVFTNQQVAFQCNGMHCLESVHWPFELMHSKSQRRFSQRVPNPIFENSIGRDYSFETMRSYFNLLRHIGEYSGRDLSYQSDRLNAFLGVLADWGRRDPPIHHVWGVPVILGNLDILSLVQRTQVSVNIMLADWFHDRPCSRRPEFPSWSWAGWSG
ncbi:heterokaryon incompatibility protein-domain-containing protein, partial [Lasiosphaeria ovina]